MALTKNGFTRETYETVLQRMETKAREVFGENVNTSQRSVLGMILRVVAYPMALLWQDVEDVHHSNDRAKATGSDLDVHAANNGTTREPATQAWGYITLETDGEEDVRIAQGAIFTSIDDAQYYNVNETLITKQARTAQLEIVAVEAGTSGNANVGEINALLNPQAHITRIYNADVIANGEDVESDAALQRRLDLLIRGMGGATAAAIEARLLRVAGVRSAFVDENYGDTVTSYGTPVSAFQAFVTSGNDRDIAQAILETKAAGIESYGNTSIVVTDTNGRDKTISFSRVDTEPVQARVRVVTDDTFTNDGTRQINDIVYSAIGGYDSVNGVQHDNILGLGGRIVASHIMSTIMTVQGVTDVELTLVVKGFPYINRNVGVSEYRIADVTECVVSVVDELV